MTNVSIHTEIIMNEKCDRCEVSVRDKVFVIDVTECYLEHPKDRASYVEQKVLVNSTRKFCEKCWRDISALMSYKSLKRDVSIA